MKPLRFDEDWRPLCDAARRSEWLDPIKCLRIAPGLALTFGGELRERIEVFDNPGFGVKQRSDHVLLHRVLLHADLRLDDTVRAFVQLGALNQNGREGPRAATDVDRFDLMQGFIDLSVPVGDGRATLRGGRQELSFGSQRLVSVRDGPNLRRTFDGGRGFWAGGLFRVDALYVRPVLVGAGVFDDRANRSEALWGMYGTGPVIGPLHADLYYLGYERSAAKFASGVGDERRHSFGLRLFGTDHAVDWDVEGVYQIGRFGTHDVEAWTVASDIGITLDAMPGKLRLGLKADVASGNRGGRTLGTFNALYPKLPYFSEAGLIAPANIIDLHPTARIGLAPTVRASVEWNWLWRETTRDAVYAPPLSAIPGTASRGGRFTGQQAIAGIEWQTSPQVTIATQYVHFFPGGGLRSVNGRSVDFVFASASYRF